MLSSVIECIAETAKYPEFSEFYQSYIKEIQDTIISNELAVNEYKMVKVNSSNQILIQLNELTEELNIL